MDTSRLVNVRDYTDPAKFIKNWARFARGQEVEAPDLPDLLNYQEWNERLLALNQLLETLDRDGDGRYDHFVATMEDWGLSARRLNAALIPVLRDPTLIEITAVEFPRQSFCRVRDYSTGTNAYAPTAQVTLHVEVKPVIEGRPLDDRIRDRDRENTWGWLNEGATEVSLGTEMYSMLCGSSFHSYVKEELRDDTSGEEVVVCHLMDQLYHSELWPSCLATEHGEQVFTA